MASILGMAHPYLAIRSWIKMTMIMMMIMVMIMTMTMTEGDDDDEPCHQVLELVDQEGRGQCGNPPVWDRDQLPDHHTADHDCDEEDDACKCRIVIRLLAY